jgi:hypothetical protein
MDLQLNALSVYWLKQVYYTYYSSGQKYSSRIQMIEAGGVCVMGVSRVCDHLLDRSYNPNTVHSTLFK